MKLVLIRHGQSEWNKSNQFTGWTDVPLTRTGRQEAITGGNELKKRHADFDLCYTSYLKRAISTLDLVLETMDRQWLPVTKSWLLNERHYGFLQGLNKEKTTKQYGQEQVQQWRRSYDVRPPILDVNDSRNPVFSDQYRNIDKNSLPLTESLKDTYNRVIPFFESQIKPNMLAGKRVLIVAHGNSIRALVKYFENMSEEDIVNINIPTGVPLEYQFGEELRFVSKQYLADEQLVNQKIAEVAHQSELSVAH